MPMRRIPKNYRNVTGIAAHRKSEGQAMFESTLERDFLTLLAFDPNVTSFEVQPVQIMWSDLLGKSHCYTPDVMASFAQPEKTILYEVKYRSELREDWNLLRPKFKAAHHYARSRDWHFKLITDAEIKTPYLENAKFLLPILRQMVPTSISQEKLLLHLNRLHMSTPAILVSQLSESEWGQAEFLSILWYLIGTKKIGCDLQQKITMNSAIWSVQL